MLVGTKFMIRLFFILFATTAFGQTIDKEHELLWEISGNGLKSPSYLFGSLHSNDRRLFNFTDSTYVAMDRSKMIVLETDIFSIFENVDTRRQEVRMKYDNKGEPYTANPEATQTVYGDEEGMPQFIDAYFQQYCYNANKKFYALETVDFQIDLFSDIQIPEFTEMKLESFLTSREDMVNLYLEGDIYGLDDLLRVSLSMYPDMYNEMIVKRNFTMVAGIDSLLKIQDNVFCAVGAGHLAGGSGIINLLRSKGYSVRKVLATYSDAVIAERDNVKSQRYYNYENDSLGVHIRFPGKPIELTSDYDDYVVKLIYRDLGQGNTYEVELYQRTFDIGMEDLASRFIASPAESPYEKIALDNGGEAFEGLADSYPVGLHWTRVVMSEDMFAVIKSYGGNKFMNSPRPFRFFDQVRLD